MKFTIGSTAQGDLSMDLDKLVEQRLLIQSNSGGGKSWLIRRILEQTNGKIQQIVIDPEGEFASLRDTFDDYVLVGKGGDIPASTRSAELLARRLLELGASAIIDLFELKPYERPAFVRSFLNSMMNAPKDLWHPVLVVIDEAHTFAPEGSKGHSEALESVRDLASRGRKRGFCAVIATQRIAKLDKDVAAECNNKLIGRAFIQIDLNRAGEELGLTSKDEVRSIRMLKPGEFYAFGQAMSEDVVKVKVGSIMTRHGRQVRSFGADQARAAPDKIRAMLQKLSDLPQEAQAELKTKEEMARKIRELETVNRALSKTTTVDRSEVDKARIDEKRKAHEATKVMVKVRDDALQEANRRIKLFKSTLDKIKELSEEKGWMTPVVTGNMPAPGTVDFSKYRPVEPVMVDVVGREARASVNLDKNPERQTMSMGDELKGAELRILKVIASFGDLVSKNRVALVTGYSVNGGGFSNYLSSLKSKGYIAYVVGKIVTTSLGNEVAGPVEPVPSGDDLIRFWCQHLKAAGKILKVICDSYPNKISVEEVALQTGYSPEGGGFSNYLSTLKTNGLITRENGMLRASDEFFR